MKRVLFFFGTRPEAIKMAPVIKAFAADRNFRVTVAVSAQHRQMLDQVLKVFKLKAQVDLDVMRPKQSLYGLTARVITAFEPVLKRVKPHLVLVHGDTTTTLAGALAAYYMKIPVGHVEAGLRTRDIYQPFPEEINRRLTDGVATLHFAPTQISRRNLLRENIAANGVFVTGNTVIDALLQTAKNVTKPLSKNLKTRFSFLNRSGQRFIFMTAHRRENFGRPMAQIFEAVRTLARRFPHVHWIYPVHPNPNVSVAARKALGRIKNVHLLAPLDYSDAVWLLKKCSLVVTDSGGLQEEAPALGKPVLVLRAVTERPEAVVSGTVKLVGSDKEKIIREASKLLTDSRAYKKMAAAVNPYGDGRAARRTLDAVRWYFGLSRKRPAAFKP